MKDLPQPKLHQLQYYINLLLHLLLIIYYINFELKMSLIEPAKAKMWQAFYKHCDKHQLHQKHLKSGHKNYIAVLKLFKLFDLKNEILNLNTLNI